MTHSAVNLPPDANASLLRLTPRNWLVLLLLSLGLWHLPRLWERIEPLDIRSDGRIPYSLGNDYWVFERLCRAPCAGQETLIVGDSVVWGHYVPHDETLSAQLNRLEGTTRFVNLGVDGVQPAALLGLVEYYGRAIAERDVILHCNLLWMSSRRHDLQLEKETPINHPALIPQFAPRIPCYGESLAGRLGIVVGRHVPLLAWGQHLQYAYFGGQSFAAWTLEHPYANPVRTVSLRLPPATEGPQPPPVAEPWTKAGLRPFSAAWVDLETSFQWRFFRETVDLLRRRGNRLRVLVGPFNEHMLTASSRAVYRERLAQVEQWLVTAGIAHHVSTPLPSEEYADASHPLAAGYARLAQRLRADPAWKTP